MAYTNPYRPSRLAEIKAAKRAEKGGNQGPNAQSLAMFMNQMQTVQLNKKRHEVDTLLADAKVKSLEQSSELEREKMEMSKANSELTRKIQTDKLNMDDDSRVTGFMDKQITEIQDKLQKDIDRELPIFMRKRMETTEARQGTLDVMTGPGGVGARGVMRRWDADVGAWMAKLNKFGSKGSGMESVAATTDYAFLMQQAAAVDPTTGAPTADAELAKTLLPFLEDNFGVASSPEQHDLNWRQIAEDQMSDILTPMREQREGLAIQLRNPDADNDEILKRIHMSTAGWNLTTTGLHSARVPQRPQQYTDTGELAPQGTVAGVEDHTPQAVPFGERAWNRIGNGYSHLFDWSKVWEAPTGPEFALEFGGKIHDWLNPLNYVPGTGYSISGSLLDPRTGKRFGPKPPVNVGAINRALIPNTGGGVQPTKEQVEMALKTAQMYGIDPSQLGLGPGEGPALDTETTLKAPSPLNQQQALPTAGGGWGGNLPGLGGQINPGVSEQEAALLLEMQRRGVN